MITSIIDIPRDASLKEEDRFRIEPFEMGLTSFIQDTNTPITIALQGEWGSGKTSLMNSLKLNLCNSQNSSYHYIWLNTWEYALMKDASTTLVDIITKLIEEVTRKAGINDQDKNRLLRKARQIGFSVLKVASSIHSTAKAAVDEAEKYYTDDSDVTIGKIRDELETIIDKCIQEDNSKKGFIFFIDDLDRIDPPVAVQLLELLKNIFTIKKCVFILAIDYDVVIKGLEPKFGKLSAVNEREFRSFFDKIIQVPFSMPVSSYDIDKFLTDSLVSINYLNKEQVTNEKLIGKFSEIANLSVGKNPRALKRLMNSLSLISCINNAKGNNHDSDQLNEDIELLVNFALVSIQIAYPPVYRLLSQYSGFDKWNENVALQMNLKPLDEQSINKLNQSEEFDDEWEQVLFRLCENDFHLKKRALYISRLLNSLKVAITENGEDIENIIGSVVSLSSVTNLEAFDKPEIDYHRGNFLKHIRHLIIPELRKILPEVGDTIQPQGKRVQSNAYIKFTPKDWEYYIKILSHPHEGGIRLIMISDKWMAPVKNFESAKDSIIDFGFEDEVNKLEKDYNVFINNHPNFEATNLFDQVSKREGCFVVEIYTYLKLDVLEDFYKPENVKQICLVIADMYRFLIRMGDLGAKVFKLHHSRK